MMVYSGKSDLEGIKRCVERLKRRLELHDKRRSTPRFDRLRGAA